MDNTELDGELDLTSEDIKAKIAQEIAKLSQLEGLGEDEITIRMYADTHSITYARAQSSLSRAYLVGVVTRRKVSYEGHECWAYRLVDSASETLGSNSA